MLVRLVRGQTCLLTFYNFGNRGDNASILLIGKVIPIETQ